MDRLKYARRCAPRVTLLVAFAASFCGCQPDAHDVQGSLPDWARTGNFSFARWDGGPVEASKGALSGWPGFLPPDPQVIEATKNLYDPGTIQLIDRAHVNWIWVTWSTGFSNQTEAPQQAQLRSYIEECHRHGIHVTAYMSVANIFWEDMFLHVPESRNWVLKVNGQPVPYPAADYAAVGRVTRYMADLSSEAWQQYTFGRVRAAVSAGADGIVFDNASSLYGRALLGQFAARALAEARTRNPRILLMSNYPSALMLVARAENAITSELGAEPGIFAAQPTAPDQWNTAPELLKVADGFLALNAGRLRALWAVSQGARPVVVEYGNRHSGDRFLNTLSPSHQKLAIAECAAFHAANEQYHESATLRDLLGGQSEATQNWEAVAQYNSFLQQYAEFYRAPISKARLAVVVDAAVSDIGFLNALAARNLIYDVVFEQDATPEDLAPYGIVVAAPAVSIRSGWQRYEQLTPAELADASPGTVTAPDSVVVNINGQALSSRILVHLLNYADAPVFNIGVKIKGVFATARLLSPDMAPQAIPAYSDGQFTYIQVPEVQIYDLLLLEP